MRRGERFDIRRAGRWCLRHALLAPILAGALWLRLSGVGDEHLYGDEAEYAIIARSLSQDFTNLAYPTLSDDYWKPFVSQPPLVLYLMAMSMRVLGATDLAAHVPSALLGAASVVAVYAIGNRLGGRLMATVAAALLALLPFHVDMSRNVLLETGYSFFLLVSAYFLVAWAQERRASQAVGAGVGAALAALSKLPGVLAGPVLAAVFAWALVVALVRRDRQDAARTTRHAALAAVPVALGALAYLALLSHLGATDALFEKLSWQAERVSGSEGGGGQDAWFYLTDPEVGLPATLGRGALALSIVGLAFALFRTLVRPAEALAHAVVPLLSFVVVGFLFLSARKVGFYLVPLAPLATLLVGGAGAGVRDLVKWGGIRFRPRDVRHIALVSVALGAVAALTPVYAIGTDSYDGYGSGIQPGVFGYGFREAAGWIEERDPEAAQFGTLLGRYTLRWYNDHPTFHQFKSAEEVEQAVLEGRLRYLVVDQYYRDPGDEEVLDDLIERHDGVLSATFERDWGRVDIYELRPHGAPLEDWCFRRFGWTSAHGC